MENNQTELDKYIVLKTLGTGYSGKVKLGKDKDTNKLYALKILDPKKKNFSKILKTLDNECKIMRNLSHPNIIEFVDVKIDGVLKKKDGKIWTISVSTSSCLQSSSQLSVEF